MATIEHAARLSTAQHVLDSPHPSLALRAQVALARRRLDRELADNPSPRWTAALRLRAAQLVSDGIRRDLARALDGMLELAEERAEIHARPAADVLGARPALEALSRRLRSARPVNTQGMARVAMLVACHGDLNPDRPSSQLTARAVGALRTME